ncbi:MAG: maleylacetoacetate isomerase [Myxococcales bacterium]|nr:maleylacetoacetate isomerase [Myxococcales bacterium]
MAAALELFSYWRSSSSWRVRIALAFKGLEYTYRAVPLLESAQRTNEHLGRNAMGQIPVLTIDGEPLSQSLAILSWLEDVYPSPALLPSDPLIRARTIALAEIINAGIQPAQNLSLLKQVEALAGKDARMAWGKSQIEAGLSAFQREVSRTKGTFCVGDSPTWADLCLVPQLYNARRFSCDLRAVPTLLQIESACAKLPAFAAAHPDEQPDAA